MCNHCEKSDDYVCAVCNEVSAWLCNGLCPECDSKYGDIIIELANEILAEIKKSAN